MSVDPASRRRIGRTSLEVSALGFGAAPIGNLFTPVAQDDVHAAVDAAIAGGIHYFDTAPFYGHGYSERQLGDALRKHPRGSYVLSSKVGRLLRPSSDPAPTPGAFAATLPFDIVFDYSSDGAMRSIEDSLQRLGLASLDIVFIHDVTRKWRGDGHEESYRQSMSGAYRALERLRSEGTISAIGVGINETSTLERYALDGDFDCFMLAGRYTLLDTTALSTLLPLCQRKQISIILAAPFNSGILVTGAKPGAKYWYDDAPADILARVTRIEAAAKRHGISLQAAAIQFPLAHPVLASVPAGYRTAREVEAALSASRERIPAAFWDELRAEALIDATAPVPTGPQ